MFTSDMTVIFLRVSMIYILVLEYIVKVETLSRSQVVSIFLSDFPFFYFPCSGSPFFVRKHEHSSVRVLFVVICNVFPFCLVNLLSPCKFHVPNSSKTKSWLWFEITRNVDLSNTTNTLSLQPSRRRIKGPLHSGSFSVNYLSTLVKTPKPYKCLH